MATPLLTPGEPEDWDVFGGAGLTWVELAFVLVGLVVLLLAARGLINGPKRRRPSPWRRSWSRWRASGRGIRQATALKAPQAGLRRISRHTA